MVKSSEVGQPPLLAESSTVVQLPLHNHTLGIHFVTNILLSTAIHFPAVNRTTDDVIKFLRYSLILGMFRHALRGYQSLH